MSQDRLAGRSPDYLRDVQYAGPAKLTARADLHRKYGTAEVAWVPWVRAQMGGPAAGDVLEAGCGPGWLWGEEGGAPTGASLTLTDLSPGMVEVAAARARARGWTVEARVADVRRLPFAPDRFDLVVANHMLYHLPDPREAVAELVRVGRPGGILVAATNGPRHLAELWEIRAEVFGGAPTSAHPDIFGTVTGAAMLSRHFTSVEWRPYEDRLLCTSPDDVVAFLTSAPPGEEASGPEREELRRAVDRRFAAGGGVLAVTKESGLFLASTP